MRRTQRVTPAGNQAEGIETKAWPAVVGTEEPPEIVTEPEWIKVTAV